MTVDSDYAKLTPNGQPTRRYSKRPSKRVICCCIVMLVVAVLAVLGSVGAHSLGLFTYPLHAQCTIEWEFDVRCDEVAQRLQDQIKKWTTDATCGTGQKCLYKFVSYHEPELKATHETPVKHYIDDLTFTFKTSPPTQPTCKITAYSRSQTWYAYLDYGTNYCNLRNLADGAELTKDPAKYKESTSDSVCTQYTSRNCEKY